MLKTIATAFLPFLIFFGNGTVDLLTGLDQYGPKANTGILEKMIVAEGTVVMDVDLNRLSRPSAGKTRSVLTSMRFGIVNDSFFTVMLYNDEVRGPIPSSMEIVPEQSAALPSRTRSISRNLMFERTEVGAPHELAVRDTNSGLLLFYVEGHEYSFEPGRDILDIHSGRLVLSYDYASELGRPSDAGAIVGSVSVRATMKPIEVTEIVDGDIVSNVMPSISSEEAGTVPGPDVIVGDVNGLAQFGSASGGYVGLALGTDSCNAGTIDLNWFALPNNDHPVIPQNLYRMSGGADNTERFEQIGQSNVKHGFTALTQNICGFGCNGVGGSRLGSGCSDPYSANLNAGPSLGSRAWINPFTGAFPRGDSATPPNSHTGHTHPGPAHRILTEIDDLNTSLNQGATYYAEGQYVTPHEYAWCVSNPTQCNMYNNVSYRRYNVSGTASPFSFSPASSTVRGKAAIDAWTGSVSVEIRPAPGTDGIGAIAYKVTNPSPGVWHYEYVIYNQNIDRAIQSFSVPTGAGVTLSNIGFHSPPQHPGWSGDGTVGNAGFSNAPWAQSQANGMMTWSSETFAQNPNANAIRWGTMYSFRFDSNRPPVTRTGTIGFYKTGEPINVQIQAPSSPSVNVTVSGRVTTNDGRGVNLAVVSMTDSGGNVRYTLTNPFGHYRFPNVATGGMYTVAVGSKQHTFASQNVPVNDHISDLNFVAQP